MGVSQGGTSTNVPIVVLRGQRPSEVTITVDPAVPLYFAEVGLTPTQGTNLAMYDLANVQVLKGPQGTLFGRNSTGGALLLTPQTPGDEFGGYAEAKLGDYNLYHFEGAVDLPATDTLKFRLAGRSLDRDGYQSNVADNALRGDDKFWDENSYGLRLTASFTPTDGFSNLTTIGYDENEMLARVTTPQAFNSDAGLGRLINVVHNGRLGGAFGTPVGKNVDAALERQRSRDWHEIETDVRAEEKIENWFAANTTEFELTDNLRIKNVFGYRDLDYSYPGGGDVDGTALPILGSRTSLTEAVTLHPAIGSLEAEQYSDELQLLGTAFDDQAGVDRRRLLDAHGGFAINAAAEHRGEPRLARGTVTHPRVGRTLDVCPNRLLPGCSGRRCRKRGLRAVRRGHLHVQRAVVAHPRRPPELGRSRDDDEELFVRHHDLEVWVSVRDENGVLLPDDACEREVDESFDHATWRTALNYSPTEDMLIYGSIATGYRTGGFNGRGYNNFTLQPFDEETVLNYELGHKTDWQLGEVASMRTNLAIYLQQYEDIQKTVSGYQPG